MTDNFDLALNDLGFSTFGDKDFFHYSLQREDNSVIDVTLYRDQEEDILHMSAFTSNVVPYSISRQFFNQFAKAALEPFRNGVGVGIPEESERICVYYNLTVKDYQSGKSVLALENIIDQVEKLDEILPMAAG